MRRRVPSPAVDYIALYRKYRPQSFEDVIGQTHVTTTLAREIAEGHVAHAYLFTGPRGTGKTTTARILAKALNCENRNADGSPDGTCASCISIAEGTSLDVMELDAASHNSVDDIRDIRVSVATVASTSTAKRIYILDEAHMLSKAAGNALLKTLEEPPEHVHFVLATTEPYKLLDTIRSRAQRFDFHSVGAETLAAHMSRIAELEGLKTDPSALLAVARHALGSVRDSLSLLEQVAALGGGSVDLGGVTRALGLADADAFGVLVQSIREQDARTALELVARLASKGVDLRRFVSESVGFFRGVFLAHYAPNVAEVADEPEEVIQTWRTAASRLGPNDVLRAVDVLGEALVRLREGREERLMLELALIRLTRPESATDPEAMMARLERLEKRVASGAAGEPAKPRAAEAAPSVPRPEPKFVEEAATPAAVEEPVPVTPSPADPEQTALATVTAEAFEAAWPELFGGLRDVLGSRRWALFRETEPLGVSGGKLIIGVRHDFHLKALTSDPAVSAIVATKAGDVLGGAVSVEFRAIDGPAEPAEAEEFETEKDRLLEAPADTVDPMKLMEAELGATLIEEVETAQD